MVMKITMMINYDPATNARGQHKLSRKPETKVTCQFVLNNMNALENSILLKKHSSPCSSSFSIKNEICFQ
jgi:hypothetical protein